MSDLLLVVGGVRYGGWKSLRVTRSVESLSGSFVVDVSDRWGELAVPWPIVEEDEFRAEIDGEVVVDGYIDKRKLSATKDSRTLSYEGHDRAAALVECSAIVKAGTVSKSKWTFYNVDVVGLAKKLAEPFGISVSVQAGLGAVLTKHAKVVVHPGDTCFEVLHRVASAAGVLVVSDGAGGILVTRGATERAMSLVEGQNIEAIDVEYDATERFYKYLISSQVPGTDDASADDTRIQAEATDAGVRRTERTLLIRPETGYSLADSRRRADWEARIRAAQSEKVSVTVCGWRQSNGKLWSKSVNALTRVVAPRSAGVDGDLRISQAEYTIGNEGGEMTTLSLVRPDAFTPEPTATVKDPSVGAGAWKAQFEKGKF